MTNHATIDILREEKKKLNKHIVELAVKIDSQQKDNAKLQKQLRNAEQRNRTLKKQLHAVRVDYSNLQQEYADKEQIIHVIADNSEEYDLLSLRAETQKAILSDCLNAFTKHKLIAEHKNLMVAIKELIS